MTPYSCFFNLCVTTHIIYGQYIKIDLSEAGLRYELNLMGSGKFTISWFCEQYEPSDSIITRNLLLEKLPIAVGVSC